MNNKKGNSPVEQIDVISIVKDVFREWLVIILLSVSVALFANAWMNYSYVPQYTASSTFVVTAKGMNTNIYQNLTSAKELAVNFSNILESNVLKKKVTEDLGMSSFNATTSVEILPETNLIELKVTAGTAYDAYRIMNSIMSNYNSVSDYVISNVILEVIKAPTIPVAPSNPLNTRSVMKKAAVITAAVLVLGLAVLSYLKDTVKNKNEVSEKIDAKLLGIVSHERKAKTLKEIKKAKSLSMLISNPLLSFRFVESNKMMAARVRSKLDKHGHKVVMLTSVIENEGKSTVAANLALSLVQENKKVLLLDCDFRKPAQYKIFEADEKYIVNLPEMLSGNIDLNVLSKQFEDTGLYTVFNKKSSTRLESLLEKGGLQKFLELAKDEMDYIIMDTSPMALISDTEELAHLADATILVVRQDTVLAKDINDAVDTLEKTGTDLLGCIFNDATSGIRDRVGHYGYGGYYGYGRYGYGRYGYGGRNGKRAD